MQQPDELIKNWVDVVILLIVAWNIAKGLQRGFLGTLIDLAEFILSLVVALSLYVTVGDIAAEQYGVPGLIARPLAFGALWLVTSIVVGLGGRLIAAPFSRIGRGSVPDLILSIIPSGLKGIAVAAFIVTMILAVPTIPAEVGGGGLDSVHEAMQSSALANALAERASGFDRTMRDLVGQPLTQTLTFVTVKPDSNERVSLDFSDPNPSLDAQAADRLFLLVNQERVKAGLRPLIRDQTLDTVARGYSVFMLQNGYFGHDSPDGSTPFDRMRQGGVLFVAAGENLALAPTVDLAHQALMDSPGHRANILQPAFGRMGIGVANADGHGRMFTEDFAN